MSSFKRSKFYGLVQKLESMGEKKLISILENGGFKVTLKCNRQTIKQLVESEYQRNLEYWDLPIRFDDDWNKKQGVTTDNWQFAVNVGFTGFFQGQWQDTIYSTNRIDLFPVAGNSYVDGHFLVEAFRVLRAKKDVELIASLYCKLDDNANRILTTVPSEEEKEFVVKVKKILNQILTILHLSEETYEFLKEDYRFEPPKEFSIDSITPTTRNNQNKPSSKKPKKSTSNSKSSTKKKK